MIHAKSLPLSLWAEAVNTAIYMLNRTVSSGGSATPYEIWVGKKPTMSHLRIFKSVVYVHVPKQFTKKFDLQGQKMILVGYEVTPLITDPTTKRVNVTRDATFHEQVGRVKACEEEPCNKTTVILNAKDKGKKKRMKSRNSKSKQMLNAKKYNSKRFRTGKRSVMRVNVKAICNATIQLLIKDEF